MGTSAVKPLAGNNTGATAMKPLAGNNTGARCPDHTPRQAQPEACDDDTPRQAYNRKFVTTILQVMNAAARGITLTDDETLPPQQLEKLRCIQQQLL